MHVKVFYLTLGLCCRLKVLSNHQTYEQIRIKTSGSIESQDYMYMYRKGSIALPEKDQILIEVRTKANEFSI